MTEKQAWIYVADKFRNNECDEGICWELQLLYNHLKLIDYKTIMLMKAKIQTEINLKIEREKNYSIQFLYSIKHGSNWDPTFNIKRAELCEQFASEIKD